ncbi:MAG: hypothetical protein NZO58_13965 [Gemmataceae bacterium]|nr:hypothetical protein [Gemmataceae bacterium]
MLATWWPWLLVPALVVGTITVGALGRRLRHFSREVTAERARELFKLQRERLEAQFLTAAAATGKPRGLRWQECQWDDGVTFVRDRQTGHIAALVGVTIRFEAIPGSDMEGLPAVGNLRNASAVFFFHRGHWHTVGKAVFNMNPDEAVRYFQNQYEAIG